MTEEERRNKVLEEVKKRGGNYEEARSCYHRTIAYPDAHIKAAKEHGYTKPILPSIDILKILLEWYPEDERSTKWRDAKEELERLRGMISE